MIGINAGNNVYDMIITCRYAVLDILCPRRYPHQIKFAYVPFCLSQVLVLIDQVPTVH